MAWLVPPVCAQVPCMYTYSYGLARTSPVCACAMHVYLLSWLGSYLACVFMCHTCVLTLMARLLPRLVCICYACLLTLMAWLMLCQCVHMLCMSTHSHGLACASPLCACAMHVYFLSWVGLCLGDVRMCYAGTLTLIAWLVPRLCVHMLCVSAYSHGSARAALMCAYAMHVYLLYWLGSCLADVCMYHACMLTLLAWLLPCRFVRML